jgi:hypothetical protein
MELEENACDCDMIVLAVLAVNCVTFTSVIYSHLFISFRNIMIYWNCEGQNDEDGTLSFNITSLIYNIIFIHDMHIS